MRPGFSTEQSINLNRQYLDALYQQWNRPEFISPDPLETLAQYSPSRDRELVALLASSMAYGKVNALLPPLRRILCILGNSPADYVLDRSESRITEDLSGIVHRFARPEHLAALLAGAGGIIRHFGSLEAAFLPAYRVQNDVICGLNALEAALRRQCLGDPGHLLPNPSRGSACKRLNLFLRWMVRNDAVDPGGWCSVSPADLLPPLDTWTYRIARLAGWTSRRSVDIKTVYQVCSALKKLNPEDPVKYDFALSRFGIRADLGLNKLQRPGILEILFSSEAG